jgi:Lysine methyltransferase
MSTSEWTTQPLKDIDDEDIRKESDDDDNDDSYDEFFQSIRSETGLEIGINVSWPGSMATVSLSTCLPQEEIAPMFHGTQWAGTRVWRASVILIQYLLSEQTPIQLGPETSVLELGCGLGVPGMVLHSMKDCGVVITDMGVLLEQLRKNLAANFTTERIRAEALDWSEPSVIQLLRTTGKSGFDLVLNCDCIYEPLYGDSWKKLLETQETLLKANPSTVMVTSIERRHADGADQYLERLAESPLVSKVERIKLDFEHAPEVEIYRAFGRTSIT